MDQTADGRSWLEAKSELAAYKLLTGHVAASVIEHLEFPVHSFTVLRDPVERTISHYFFNRSRNALPLDDRGKPIRIEDFVDHPGSRGVAYNLQTFFLAVELDREGQFLDPLSAYSPSKAIAALDRMTVVGTTDELDITIALLHRTLGWDRPQPLGTLNSTPPDAARARVKPSTLKHIEQANLMDLEVYEHARRRLRTDVCDVLGRDTQTSTKRTAQGPRLVAKKVS
jgi:hypothetical protein